MISGTSKIATFLWARGPPNHYQHASRNKENYGNILETYYLWKVGTHKVSKMFGNNVCPMYHVYMEICVSRFHIIFCEDEDLKMISIALIKSTKACI